LASLKGFTGFFRKKPLTWHRQRTVQVAEDIYAMTKTTCEKNNIQEPSFGPRRKQKRMDFVVEVSCGSSSDLLSNSEHLKQRLASIR